VELVDEELDAAHASGQYRQTVIRAGIWLLQNGFGRMQLLPYVAPSGCYWRCEFHPSDRRSQAFYKYSSSSGWKYLENHCGGSVRRSISPKALANAIMRSVPEDAQVRCCGDLSPETAAWIGELEHVLRRGLAPAAFHEYTTDYSRWDLYPSDGGGPIEERFPPQPGYVPPGEELHWSQGEFWRGADRRLAGRLALDLEPESEAQVERVALALWQVMRDVGADEAPDALRAAISLLFRH
jgi:hypothetical protein